MPQTFSAKVLEFKLPIFYKLMQELSKGNDELTFVVYYDRLVIKTSSTSTLNMITLYKKLFDSFQVESPKMYIVYSRSFRDVFYRSTANLSSLQIIIEEPDEDDLCGENLMILEICRKSRSFQSRYSITCNKIFNGISEIERTLKPLNENPLSEENHWSIDSETLRRDHWPRDFKDETVRFLFSSESLRIINLITLSSDDTFLSESRSAIQCSQFHHYEITNPMDIRVNRKSFERIMHLVCSLKCKLNAYFSDKDSDDAYQPQPFYLCGEIDRYIKIEGTIYGAHLEYGNQPERPFHCEIESALSASNQMNQSSNNNDGIEYQVAAGFRQAANSNSHTNADENYSPVACSSATTLVNGNANTRNIIDYTYRNNISHNLNHIDVNRVNTNNTSNREIHSTSNFQVYNRNNNKNNQTGDYELSSYGTSSDTSLTPGRGISRRVGTANFSDNQVGGIKRSFSATDLGDDDKYRTIKTNNVKNDK